MACLPRLNNTNTHIMYNTAMVGGMPTMVGHTNTYIMYNTAMVGAMPTMVEQHTYTYNVQHRNGWWHAYHG